MHKDFRFGLGQGLCGESACLFLPDKGLEIQDTAQRPNEDYPSFPSLKFIMDRTTFYFV